MKINVNTLTLGEAAFIERYAGVPISKLGDDDTPKMRMMTALVVVTKRREGEPQYTVAAAESLTLEEANRIVGDVDDQPENQSTEIDAEVANTHAIPDEIPGDLGL